MVLKLGLWKLDHKMFDNGIFDLNNYENIIFAKKKKKEKKKMNK